MKKKIFLVAIIGLMLMYVPTVLAADITGCNSVLSGVKIDSKIPNTVHTLIVIIKILVPILLVVFGSMDLLKGITAQKEDEIKKGQQILIKRLIAGALVFFVITIVQLVISFVSSGDKDANNMWNCVSCFINGTDGSGNCK